MVGAWLLQNDSEVTIMRYGTGVAPKVRIRGGGACRVACHRGRR